MRVCCPHRDVIRRYISVARAFTDWNGIAKATTFPATQVGLFSFSVNSLILRHCWSCMQQKGNGRRISGGAAILSTEHCYDRLSGATFVSVKRVGGCVCCFSNVSSPSLRGTLGTKARENTQ